MRVLGGDAECIIGTGFKAAVFLILREPTENDVHAARILPHTITTSATAYLWTVINSLRDKSFY